MRLKKVEAYQAALKNLEKRSNLLDKAQSAYQKAAKRLNKAVHSLSQEQREELNIGNNAEIKVNFGGIDIPVTELMEG